MNEYLLHRGALKMVFLLVDARREAQENDQAMIKFLEEEGLPFAVIATKCDKLKDNELRNALEVIR